jgi:formiminoglutamase
MSSLHVYNLGPIESELKLTDAHQQLEDTVTSVLSTGAIAFVIGGSNDQSYPNAMGLVNSLAHCAVSDKSMGVVNLDAHLDVRPLVDGRAHSGSPFRLMLERKEFQEQGYFIEFAAQGNQCSAAHAAFVEEQHKDNATIHWLSSIRRSSISADAFFQQHVLDVFAKRNKTNVFISFDIDSIRACDCPGVSCPSPVGLSAQEAMDIAMLCGSSGTVRVFDVSEFNPRVEDYMTGKLVANIFYHFLIGLCKIQH